MKNGLRECKALMMLLLLAGCGGQSGTGGSGLLSSSPAPLPATTGGSGTATSSGGTSGSGSTGSGSTGTAGSGTTGGSTTGSGTPAPPANAKTISGIERLTGWESCTDCANGAAATYSMTQGIVSPSLTGSAVKFSLLGGTAPWGQALWWKYLTRDDSVTHFVYDLYFYMDNPAASQALEFSVSQSVGGNRYEFATQCAMAGEKIWRVWDPTAYAWAGSSVGCPVPAANTWNHLTWEFSRNSSNQLVFEAVTLNGNRGIVNMTMPHTSDSSNGFDVSFQEDAKDGPILYSVWVDKVSLTYW